MDMSHYEPTELTPEEHAAAIQQKRAREERAAKAAAKKALAEETARARAEQAAASAEARIAASETAIVRSQELQRVLSGGYKEHSVRALLKRFVEEDEDMFVVNDLDGEVYTWNPRKLLWTVTPGIAYGAVGCIDRYIEGLPRLFTVPGDAKAAKRLSDAVAQMSTDTSVGHLERRIAFQLAKDVIHQERARELAVNLDRVRRQVPTPDGRVVYTDQDRSEPRTKGHFFSRVIGGSMSETRCEIVENFLNSLFPDPQRRQYELERIGVAYGGDIKSAMAHWNIGASSNGKSCFADFRCASFGQFGVTLSGIVLLKHKKDPNGHDAGMVEAANARCIEVSEVPNDTPMDEDGYKRHIADKTRRIRGAYGKTQRTVPNMGTWWISVNDYPRFSSDPAIARRSAMHEWPFTFSDDPDPMNPNDRLLNESLPDLLESQTSLDWFVTLCIRAAREFYASGASHKKLPPCISAFSAAIKTDRDSVRLYLDTCIVRAKTGADGKVPFINGAAFRNDYNAWCTFTDNDAVGPQAFAAYMGKVPYISKRVVKGITQYTGIAFSSDRVHLRSDAE